MRLAAERKAWFIGGRRRPLRAGSSQCPRGLVRPVSRTHRQPFSPRSKRVGTLTLSKVAEAKSQTGRNEPVQVSAGNRSFQARATRPPQYVGIARKQVVLVWLHMQVTDNQENSLTHIPRVIFSSYELQLEKHVRNDTTAETLAIDAVAPKSDFCELQL